MNKIFYLLLFLSVAGAGVLWWLLNSLPHETSPKDSSVPEVRGVIIEDQAPPADAETASGHIQGTEPLPTAGFTVLSIGSEPSGATVLVDGRKVGETPLEWKLGPEVQKLRFELKGHEPVEREAPKEEVPGGGLMNWKIRLQPLNAAASTSSQVVEDESQWRFMGPVGPHFVQVKAVEADSALTWSDQVKLFRKKLGIPEEDKGEGIYACRVDLGARGFWIRYLVGPYATRPQAQQQVPRIAEGLGIKDVFVTGAQTCLE